MLQHLGPDQQLMDSWSMLLSDPDDATCWPTEVVIGELPLGSAIVVFTAA